MSSIDNRIVAMKFDNAQFERGVSTTISSMDKLKHSLNFTDAQKNLQGLGGSIAKFNMGGMEGAVTGVSKAFLAMSTIGITALSNITTKAMNAGTQLVKSLTIDPIAAGFSEYELKLGSIQTILANTAKYGTKLPEVTKVLEDLNEYSDKTIYNFGDMTKNIGLFTNAGIKVRDAAEMIKGFSNEAAASGTSAQGAAAAAYQLSQALSAGKVTLMDWKSLTNVGMGNKNMQQGIIDIADAMGTFNGKGIDAADAQKNFNGTLEKGWLTADVMSTYLKIMSGDIDEAKMKSLGLSEAQIKMFKQQQKTAEDAATKVRTFSQLMGTLRESVGSGWSQTFEIIFGDFEEATKLFTGISNALGGWINANAEARNKVLEDWKELGGRTHLIEGIKNIFEALGRVLGPIKDAFRDIFPPMTGQRLFDMTIAFENFTKRLKISDEVMDNLKRTFKGVFAIFSLLKTFAFAAAKIILSVFDALAGPTGGAGGGFLAITANIGDFISGIDAMVKKSKVIEKFFGAIGGAIAGVITIIADVGKSIFGLFTGGDTPFLDNLAANFENLAPLIDGIKTKISDIIGTIKGLFSSFHIDTDMFGLTPAVDNATTSLSALEHQVEDTTSFLDGFKDILSSIGKAIGAAFEWVGDQLQGIFAGTNLQDWLSLINTAFVISFVRTISKVFRPLADMAETYGSMLQNMDNILGGFSGTVKAMSMDLKASAIMKIALALLFLAAAIFLLSFVEPAEVGWALTALAGSLGLLIGAFKAFSKEISTKDAAKLIIVSGALILMALAMTTMAGAIALLGNMDVETLKKGIGSIAAILGLLVISVTAFKVLGGPKTLAGTAAALIVMSIALSMLAGVILMYAAIDFGTVIDGLIRMVLVLGVLAIFMKLISGAKMEGSMVGLVAAAIAMGILADALKKFGEIPLSKLAKGIWAISMSLGLLVIAVLFMQGALAGAAALLITVAALNLLVPVLEKLGDMSWGAIAKGLVALAGALLVITIGGIALTYAAVGLLAFGAAVLLLGAGLFLAGTGMLVFASGLALLTVVGAAGFAVLTAAIITFVELLPLIGEQVGLAFVAWAKVIGDKAPELVRAMGKLFSALLAEIRKRAPEFYDTMITLLIQLLDAITKKLPDFVKSATTLIETFVDTFGSQENLTRLTTAGADLVINLINSIADTIEDKDDEMIAAGEHIGGAIVKGVGKGLMKINPIMGAVSWLVGRVKGQAEEELESNSPSKVFIRIGATIPEGMGVGITKYTNVAVSATEAMGDATITTMQETMGRISEAIDTDIDAQPVIAPVLDLTEFRKTATEMDKVLQVTPLTATVTFEQAAGIAATRTPIEEAALATGKEQTPIKFEQNNYSPKALSPSEIYRNTRNQLTFAKELIAG